MSVAVTLDTNVAIRVANHILGVSKKDPLFARLAEGVTRNSLASFVSEASLSFELLSTEERVIGVLSGLAVLSEHRALQRAEIPHAACRRAAKYIDAGFRFLHAPRAGLRAFLALQPDTWATDERFDINARLARYAKFGECFAYMGPHRLKDLGADLARKRGLASAQIEHLLGRPVSVEELWVDGLIAEVRQPSARRTKPEVLGQIQKLFADWLDLDSVASHYAYGLDFFCTEDRGRGNGRFEIFHPANRRCVHSEFGVSIVSPDELLAHL